MGEGGVNGMACTGRICYASYTKRAMWIYREQHKDHETSHL